MRRVVAKFGGSVIKTPADLNSILSAVKSYTQKPILIVSALYGVTEKLGEIIEKRNFQKENISKICGFLKEYHFGFIDHNFISGSSKKEAKLRIKILLLKFEEYLTGLHLIKDIPDFSGFYVKSFGERLSSQLISSFLNSKEIKNILTTPEEIGLFADRCTEDSSVDFARSENYVNEFLREDTVYVIPGYYGKINGTRVALFGKGGSDYTAAAIAKLTDAEYCDLWKDVDGFMTADPKLEKDAKRIDELTYDEAAELSYFGARIIHPETFGPLKKAKIPLRIFNIKKFANTGSEARPSTTISCKGIINKTTIKSITYSNDYSILRVKGSGVGIHPGIISRISDSFNRIEINIRSIITTQTSINFLLASSDMEHGYSSIRNMELPGVEKIEREEDISLIAAVGTGIRERYGIASKILSALSERKINIRLITAGASDEAIYFTLKKQECFKAVTALHKQFFKKGGKNERQN